MAIQSLNLEKYSNIVILTGAGVSAGSGLPTFRGPGGLWNGDVDWVSDARNLPGSLMEVWKFYGWRREGVLKANPNAAHLAIAKLQQERPDAVTLVTQNVDGLHGRAGSPQVTELHGSIFRTRCTNEKCSSEPFYDESIPPEPPPCPVCGGPMRPDIVLFHEMLPVEATDRAKRALRDCDLFLAIGTSGTVYPANAYVRSAAYAGARTVLINLTPMEERDPDFQEEYLGKAEEMLPSMFDVSV